MASVNQAIIVGYVGGEPKVKDLANGIKVVNISVCTTEKGYTSKDGKVIPDKNEWHNVVLWRSMADYAAKFVKKGSLVYVQGKMRTNSFDGQDGQKKYRTDIEAEMFQILEKKESYASSPQPQHVTQNTQTMATQQEMPLNVEQTIPRQRMTDADDLPF